MIVFVLYCVLLLSLTFLVIQPLGCERDINKLLLITYIESNRVPQSTGGQLKFCKLKSGWRTKPIFLFLPIHYGEPKRIIWENWELYKNLQTSTIFGVAVYFCILSFPVLLSCKVCKICYTIWSTNMATLSSGYNPTTPNDVTTKLLYKLTPSL